MLILKYVSIRMLLFTCDDYSDIVSKKHIFPLPSKKHSPVDPNSSEKNNRCLLVRGFIEAERRSLHSSPYNHPTLGYYSPAVSSSHLSNSSSFSRVSVLLAIQVLFT